MSTLASMKPSYTVALIVGAVTGLVLALSLTLYVGGTGGVPSVDAIVEGSRVVPVFASAASALWIVLILSTAVGGLLAAVVTKAVARTIDPDAQSASLGIIAPLGMVVAPVIGMAVFPLGVTVVGSISEGTVTISVVEMVVLASIVGIVAGGFVVWLSYVLARPPVAKEDTTIHMDMVDRSA